jgi:hypothetical protein
LKIRIVAISLLVLCLLVLPAVAQSDVYDNGPINGNVDSWTVNFGFAVSDSFTLASSTTVNGLSFGAWMFPGDILETAEISITSSEFGGTTYFDGVVSFSQGSCRSNGFGFNVCTETGSLGPVNLNAGTYWLNMQNAITNTGDPAHWDENEGPSQASENSLGTIPSESFTLLGNSNTTSTTGVTSTTPEPGAILLFGSGVLGLVGVLRRKLF